MNGRGGSYGAYIALQYWPKWTPVDLLSSSSRPISPTLLLGYPAEMYIETPDSSQKDKGKTKRGTHREPDFITTYPSPYRTRCWSGEAHRNLITIFRHTTKNISGSLSSENEREIRTAASNPKSTWCIAAGGGPPLHLGLPFKRKSKHTNEDDTWPPTGPHHCIAESDTGEQSTSQGRKQETLQSSRKAKLVFFISSIDPFHGRMISAYIWMFARSQRVLYGWWDKQNLLECYNEDFWINGRPGKTMKISNAVPKDSYPIK